MNRNSANFRLQAREGRDEGVFYPLRRPGDIPRFFVFLVILPTLFTLLCAGLGCIFLFSTASSQFWCVTLLHGVLLFLFLFLMWIPNLLAILDWRESLENLLKICGIQTRKYDCSQLRVWM